MKELPANIENQENRPTVAVIVPCYKVRNHILTVIKGLIGKVDHVYIVDDKCPDQSGKFVLETFLGHPDVTVLFHEVNQGVGGATITGYKAAAAAGYQLLVKMDGDDQMDPAYLPRLIEPVANLNADYSKGNRFYSVSFLEQMPKIRVFGNSVLSFMSKISSGYWKLMDPTNGYTCINSAILNEIGLDKINKRYFFESDLIYKLGINRAVIADVPIPARYGDEVSNLKISVIVGKFLSGHIRNFMRRFLYLYILRDFNLGSLWTIFGSLMFVFGFILGLIYLIHANISGAPTPLGIIMMAAMNVSIGLQLILSAIAYDINNEPTVPISRYFKK